ncbi:MAG TPA: radical SAM protein, partial [Candidatus Izemoplasmatales bacterium]|nr:radical SAM protein [Candidatus Izemoplasmatales bacterium]
MKTTLVGINSKYIHPNLAIRYLKANTDYPVDMIELTIKDKIEKMMHTILETQPDIVGFSVYIWNVEIIKKILKKLKVHQPKIIIVLGGPEVSYQNDVFLTEALTDFIIAHEGERSFHLLLDAIHHQKEDFSNIPNLIYIRKEKIVKNKEKTIDDLKTLANPYHVIKEKDIEHKIQYVELSRGCPYQCAYCLASLEKGLRFFEIDDVLNIIDDLISRGAKTFKFLDRSFNANHRLAQAFLKKLFNKNYKDVVFQFEINGDVLKDEFIDFLITHTPKDLIRFEIGVQSTNDKVNKAVHRYQDTNQLIKNIKHLKQAPIIFHLDLIAGLPYEDLSSFKTTFNTIYHLFPNELQLGFLKVLKGTAIERQSNKHKIRYHKEAPY